MHLERIAKVPYNFLEANSFYRSLFDFNSLKLVVDSQKQVLFVNENQQLQLFLDSTIV